MAPIVFFIAMGVSSGERVRGPLGSERAAPKGVDPRKQPKEVPCWAKRTIPLEPRRVFFARGTFAYSSPITRRDRQSVAPAGRALLQCLCICDGKSRF